MFLCLVSVYSGSKNKADTTGFCWHHFAIRIRKKSQPCLVQLGQKWVVWEPLSDKCGLFASGMGWWKLELASVTGSVVEMLIQGSDSLKAAWEVFISAGT